MGGVARKSMAGEGRVLGGIEAEAEAAGATDGAMEGLSFGCGVGEERIRMVGVATGAALAAAVAEAVGVAFCIAGVALAAAVGLAVGVALALAAGVALAAAVAAATGVAVALAAGVALAAAAGVVLAAGVVAAAAVAAGVAVVSDVSFGLTNRFEGALGGGVASALILVRARSAAERSAIAVQPLSIITSATRSFTLRGRGMSGISTITGAETSSSSPRTLADAKSPSICDCRRKR